MLSDCQGINVNDNEHVNVAPTIVKVHYVKETERQFGQIKFTKMQGKCFLIQVLSHNIVKYNHIHIFGSRYDEVSRFTVMMLDDLQLLACEKVWDMFFRVQMYSTMTSILGRGNLQNDKVNRIFNGEWSTVSFKAINAEVFPYYDCSRPTLQFAILVEEACDDLRTNISIFRSVNWESAEFSQDLKQSSGCQRFVVTVEMYYAVQLTIDDRLLCLSLNRNERFPCISKRSPENVCYDINSCVLQLQVNSILSNTKCHKVGLYVEIFDNIKQVLLRWHVKAHKKVLYATRMVDKQSFHTILMNIKFDGQSDYHVCDVEILQKIVAVNRTPINLPIVKLSPSAPCLEMLRKHNRTLCWKEGMVPEFMTLGTKTYVRVNSSSLTWTQAENFCRSLNGHLVSITSRKEADIISALFDDGDILKSTALYIGLRTTDEVGSLIQVDENVI